MINLLNLNYLEVVGVGLDCSIKANYPHVGSAPVGVVPPVEILLRDSNTYLGSLSENNRKLRTARSTSETGD